MTPSLQRLLLAVYLVCLTFFIGCTKEETQVVDNEPPVELIEYFITIQSNEPGEKFSLYWEGGKERSRTASQESKEVTIRFTNADFSTTSKGRTTPQFDSLQVSKNGFVVLTEYNLNVNQEETTIDISEDQDKLIEHVITMKTGAIGIRYDLFKKEDPENRHNFSRTGSSGDLVISVFDEEEAIEISSLVPEIDPERYEDNSLFDFVVTKDTVIDNPLPQKVLTRFNFVPLVDGDPEDGWFVGFSFNGIDKTLYAGEGVFNLLVDLPISENTTVQYFMLDDSNLDGEPDITKEDKDNQKWLFGDPTSFELVPDPDATGLNGTINAEIEGLPDHLQYWITLYKEKVNPQDPPEQTFSMTITLLDENDNPIGKNITGGQEVLDNMGFFGNFILRFDEIPANTKFRIVTFEPGTQPYRTRLLTTPGAPEKVGDIIENINLTKYEKRRRTDGAPLSQLVLDKMRTPKPLGQVYATGEFHYYIDASVQNPTLLREVVELYCSDHNIEAIESANEFPRLNGTDPQVEGFKYQGPNTNLFEGQMGFTFTGQGSDTSQDSFFVGEYEVILSGTSQIGNDIGTIYHELENLFDFNLATNVELNATDARDSNGANNYGVDIRESEVYPARTLMHQGNLHHFRYRDESGITLQTIPIEKFLEEN